MRYAKNMPSRLLIIALLSTLVLGVSVTVAWQHSESSASLPRNIYTEGNTSTSSGSGSPLSNFLSPIASPTSSLAAQVTVSPQVSVSPSPSLAPTPTISSRSNRSFQSPSQPTAFPSTVLTPIASPVASPVNEPTSNPTDKPTSDPTTNPSPAISNTPQVSPSPAIVYDDNAANCNANWWQRLIRWSDWQRRCVAQCTGYRYVVDEVKDSTWWQRPFIAIRHFVSRIITIISPNCQSNDGGNDDVVASPSPVVDRPSAVPSPAVSASIKPTPSPAKKVTPSPSSFSIRLEIDLDGRLYRGTRNRHVVHESNHRARLYVYESPGYRQRVVATVTVGEKSRRAKHVIPSDPDSAFYAEFPAGSFARSKTKPELYCTEIDFRFDPSSPLVTNRTFPASRYIAYSDKESHAGDVGVFAVQPGMAGTLTVYGSKENEPRYGCPESITVQ